MRNNSAFPMTKEQAKMFLDLSNRIHPDIPPYYDQMYTDNYQPWQIMEAENKRFYIDYIERLESYEATQRDPMDGVQIKFNSEVKVKK